MTNEEIKTKEALAYLGYNCDREVTGKELYYSYLGLKSRYNPETCVEEQYKDGVAYKKLNEYYDYLSKNICRVNETIRNIIDPAHKTYVYQEEAPKKEEAPEILDPRTDEDEPGMKPSLNNMNVMIVDKPSIFSIILSIMVPIYGIINYFLVKRLQPKASKWYLLIGILGMILNMLVLLYL